MLNGLNVVAIIPARIGSKRLPKKNLREIYPQYSLLSYAVYKLMESRYVDTIVVSTESDEVVSHLMKEGVVPPVEVLMRSPELALDNIFIMPVAKEVLEFPKYRGKFGYALVHQCDHPCTTTMDFDRALLKSSSTPYDVVISVDSLGGQTGAIRVFNPAVMRREMLEYTITTVRTEFPTVDVHTEEDLGMAMEAVRGIEETLRREREASATKPLEVLR